MFGKTIVSSKTGYPVMRKTVASNSGFAGWHGRVPFFARQAIRKGTSHDRTPQSQQISNWRLASLLNFDRWLLISVISITLLGLIMVASTSIVISEKQYHAPFHFLGHQSVYLILGIFVGILMLGFHLQDWQKVAPILLLLSYALLVLVLIPGIGREVNGSVRWIGLGSIGFQVSELAKLFIIIYLADYLSRRHAEVQTQWSGFLKPMLLLTIAALLLLKEPNFGAAVVILATALGMMFLAGVRVSQFIVLLGVVALALAILSVSSPYRLERLTAFLNPWANQFNSGYQLTQSLIAFGRGGWFGAGLGDSIQKLFYLPEAHTDFLFAVYAEEMGLVGVLALIGLFSVFIGRILWMGRRAFAQKDHFAAYLAYGMALWIGMQTLINMGVDSGLLPTKGLTLPLMSYGGSSMVVMLMAIALLLRIDYETRKVALS